jgi:L-asparaginase
MEQSRILIIYTGGTIGMVEDLATNTLKPFDFVHLSEQIPELKKFNYRMDSHSFSPPIDSSNMTPAVWVQLAEMIEKNYDNYDGFVVLHGSDTMAYTASALSFMFENLSKPVILTGSQLPIGVIRTDGKENFITAVEIAAAKENGKALVPEVCIYFENKLYRGNRTNKYNAENFEAFRSVNYPLLAEAGVYIKYNHSAIHPSNEQEFRVFKKIDTNIAILKLFPGITENAVKAILSTEGLRAVVMETFGSGNAPSGKWFIDILKQATDKGIIIYNVTQCKGGAVEIGKYETSSDLGKIGVIGGSDITTEAAVTKMMYLLGRGYSKDKIEKYLQSSLRGEMTIY